MTEFKQRRFYLLLLLPIFAGAPTVVAATPREIREVHYQMGTFLEITLWHSDIDKGKQLIRNAVWEAHRLEEILSNYDSDSALSRLNGRAGAGPVYVPADLFEILNCARKYSEKTSGLFDVTVGSLMELWRRAEEQKKLPTAQQLTRARQGVGYRYLLLKAGNQVQITKRETRIDLGGIGKGYAVDVIAQELKAADVNDALINFGGSSMLAMGAPPGKRGWEVALQQADESLGGFVYLRDTALSTSASMGKSWEIKGERYGHLIDPLSGVPMRIARMATVIARSATEAEALTKPLVLRGRNALSIIEQFPGAEAMVTSEKEPPAFSRHFSALTAWKEVRNR